MNSTLGNRHGSAVITVPSDTEILITRQFDAPAELVFSAFSTPEFVQRWYGFETSEWLVCEMDFRVGGQWRFVTRDEGMEIGFHGEYKEIAARTAWCRPRSSRACPTARPTPANPPSTR